MRGRMSALWFVVLCFVCTMLSGARRHPADRCFCIYVLYALRADQCLATCAMNIVDHMLLVVARYAARVSFAIVVLHVPRIASVHASLYTLTS